jgi:hypothetical protein
MSIWHYTIKIYARKAGFAHLKSWKVEGWSLAKNEWALLDERHDTDDLNEKSAVGTFTCQNHQPTHLIGIEQTGPRISIQ